MEAGRIQIDVPGRVSVHVAPPRADESLARWIEAAGIPLNMRCGGRGLCRGCLIQIGGADPVRSCQCTGRDLPSDCARIEIPLASLRDESLHGVVDFEVRGDLPPPVLRSGLGLALDIGTTTIAGALWDLSTGKFIASATRANAQRRYGDNIVSRITFATENPGAREALHEALVRDSLEPMVDQLCREAAIEPDAITEAAASGNPTMLHTLARASLEGFARYPFRPEFLDEREIPGMDAGLTGQVSVRLLPGVGPFVGSDILSGALAVGMLGPDPGNWLLIDFGTNGEIMLRTGEQFFVTATAAGPAFEGGRLRCGATAREGVISALSWDKNKWQSALVGGSRGPARGISGAAYVDFLAEAHAAELINTFGRFVAGAPGVAQVGTPEPEAGVELGGGQFITEADIAEILQAKAAIAAGFAVLMELAEISPADLETVFVGGGFGYHLNPRNACAVGLLPDVPDGRIELVGNSSLGGTSALLLAANPATFEGVLSRTQVVELNQQPSFEDHFTDSLMIGPAEDF
jgi:uncharacterized 2Fe-2S/4Fe-4S cluster protein (DUF4445 family)